MRIKSNRLIRLFSLAGLIYLHGIADSLAAERVVMASLSPGLFEFPIQISICAGFSRTKGSTLSKSRCSPRSLSWRW